MICRHSEHHDNALFRLAMFHPSPDVATNFWGSVAALSPPQKKEKENQDADARETHRNGNYSKLAQFQIITIPLLTPSG